MSASHQLLKSAFKTLLADSGLTDLIGPNRVFDRVPNRVDPPYAVIGTVNASDWSTATERGEEITFLVSVWSKTGGRGELLAVMDRIRMALTEAEHTLADHHLIHLRWVNQETVRQRTSGLVRGTLRFRGVTEPVI